MKQYLRKAKRVKRAIRCRVKIKSNMRNVTNGYYRLSIFRSNKHMYAQIISSINGDVVVEASTMTVSQYMEQYMDYNSQITISEKLLSNVQSKLNELNNVVDGKSDDSETSIHSTAAISSDIHNNNQSNKIHLDNHTNTTKTVKKQPSIRLTIQSSRFIGEWLAKKAVAKNISKVVFDKSGYKYHGRVAALADGARAYGLIF